MNYWTAIKSLWLLLGLVGEPLKFLLHRILYKNWFYIKIDRATSRAICFCAFQRNPKQTYYYKTFSVQFSGIRNLFNLYVVTGQIKYLAQTKYLQMHERYNVTTTIWDSDNPYFKQIEKRLTSLIFYMEDKKILRNW